MYYYYAYHAYHKQKQRTHVQKLIILENPGNWSFLLHTAQGNPSPGCDADSVYTHSYGRGREDKLKINDFTKNTPQTFTAALKKTAHEHSQKPQKNWPSTQSKQAPS